MLEQSGRVKTSFPSQMLKIKISRGGAHAFEFLKIHDVVAARGEEQLLRLQSSLKSLKREIRGDDRVIGRHNQQQRCRTDTRHRDVRFIFSRHLDRTERYFIAPRESNFRCSSKKSLVSAQVWAA
jgi:hypothetical protein